MASNYPPGVTGAEPMIAGGDDSLDAYLRDGSGLVIDGSMDSADALNDAIVRLAMAHGWDSGVDMQRLHAALFSPHAPVTVEGWDDSPSQIVSELADAAVDWMNEHVGPDLVIFIDENCLMVESAE